MKTFNAGKLHVELVKVGIPIEGVSSDGRIDFKKEATSAQKNQAIVIKENHTTDWYVEDRRKAYKSIEDQLDMLYWDHINGTNHWVNHITEVKTNHPKP